jgi:hypothetical protein
MRSVKMTPKECRYTVMHTINMGNYENLRFEASVTFDLAADADSIQSAFVTARSHIDEAIQQDLERAAQCTALTDDETYIHSWNEEIY